MRNLDFVLQYDDLACLSGFRPVSEGLKFDEKACLKKHLQKKSINKSCIIERLKTVTPNGRQISSQILADVLLLLLF